MKQKIISCIMLLTMLCSLFSVNVSANDITIYVNEQVLQCETAPFITNGRTMVPMRKIFEALSATVAWEGSTKTIIASKDATIIVLQIDNPVLYKNEEVQALDVAPVIVNDSTFVPIRAVSQSLNASVEWNGNNRTVYINSPVAYNASLGNAVVTPSYNTPAPGAYAVYCTPTGKRYHFDAQCGGVNSRQTTMEYVTSIGLTPCQKCAK